MNYFQFYYSMLEIIVTNGVLLQIVLSLSQLVNDANELLRQLKLQMDNLEKVITCLCPGARVGDIVQILFLHCTFSLTL